MDVATVSSRGQLVIPKGVREAMGIKSSDRFFVMQKDDSILLKKIDQEGAKKRMLELMDYFAEKFKEAGITREDVKDAVKWARQKNTE